MYLYMDDDGSGGGQGKTGQVATLGELSQWLEDEKKNRNFWVASIFVGGILSIVILLIRLWGLDIPPGLPPSDEPAPPRTVP